MKLRKQYISKMNKMCLTKKAHLKQNKTKKPEILELKKSIETFNSILNKAGGENNEKELRKPKRSIMGQHHHQDKRHVQ